MNSSPFLPAAPSTLNVGADDPVRPSFDFPPHPVGADAPSSAHIFEPILFFLLLRKKRTVSIFHEKKESNVPTVVLNLTQKISAISCPSRPSLPPERSLRSARAFRRCLPCDSSTAPVHRRSGLPTPPGKVSAKQTDEGREAVAVHHCNLRPSTAPVGADDSVRPLLPRSSAPKGTLF